MRKFTPWIVCLSAALFFAYELTQLHMLNAISPMLMKDLSLSATKFGYLSSTYLLADVIFLLPAGIIIDRFSPRKVILSALIICILGTLLFGTATTFAAAAFAHFLSGIGNAFCFLSCMILASRWFPVHKQALVMGVIITVGMLGGVIAQSPFTMLANSFSWRGALFIDAAIGVGVFGVIAAFVRDPKTGFKKQQSALYSFKESLNLQNISCGIYTGFMNLPIMLLGAVWGSLFLTQIHNLSLTTASLIAGMICMGTIVGSPLCGYLSDKMGRKPLMFSGAILSCVTMLLIMYAPVAGTLSLGALFFLLGLFTSTQVIGYPTIAASNPPERAGTAMGIAAVIIMGSAAVVGPISGWLLDIMWDGTLIDNVRIYSINNFRLCFWLFPIAIIGSFVATLAIKEPKQLTA